MREQTFDAERAAAREGQRDCAIHPCPLVAKDMWPVELDDGVWALLPLCWYHAILGSPDPDNPRQSTCPHCGSGDLSLAAPAFKGEAAHYRCPACGMAWHEDMLSEHVMARRNALYAQQVAEAGGAGQPSQAGGTRGGDDER